MNKYVWVWVVMWEQGHRPHKKLLMLIDSFQISCILPGDNQFMSEYFWYPLFFSLPWPFFSFHPLPFSHSHLNRYLCIVKTIQTPFFRASLFTVSAVEEVRIVEGE